MVDIVRDARVVDFYWIGNRMRKADVREVWALNRHRPLAALANSYRASKGERYVAHLGTEPVAFFGLAGPVLGEEGHPWMLGTDTVTTHARDLIDVSRQFVRHALTRYRRLSNYVHDENTASKRYLRALGFTLEDPVMMHTGAMARLFWMERGDV